jgi:hypothetical protein
MKQTPNKRKWRRHVLRRDALQPRIAAEGAVGTERIAQGHEASKKPTLTLSATPRIDTQGAEGIVRNGLSARTSRLLALADRTGHLDARNPLVLS